MLCPNCGSKCSDDAASCSKCGYRFRRPSQQRSAQSFDDRPMRQRSDSAPSAPKRRPAQSRSVANDPATEKKYIIVGAITLIIAIIVAVVLITSLSCICSNSCDACAKEASESAIADSVGGDEWGGVEEDPGVVDPNAADPNAAVDPNAAADPNAAPAAPAA